MTTGSAALESEEPFQGRLLLSDLRVAYLLFDECRYRSMARFLGVSRDQAPLVAMIGAGLVATAVRDRIVWSLSAGRAGDAVLGAGVGNVLLHRIGGPDSASIPAFGALVTIALVGHRAKPVVRASLHRARASAHHARHVFNHRYGHLMSHIPALVTRGG